MIPTGTVFAGALKSVGSNNVKEGKMKQLSAKEAGYARRENKTFGARLEEKT